MNNGIKKGMDEFAGIMLTCKYSFNCENAKLLGMKIKETLLSFIEGKERNLEKIKKILGMLNHGNDYKQIAEINKISIFLEKVASHYWKGTPVMDDEICHNFSTLVPIIDMPKDFISALMVDDCLVHPAEVTAKYKEKVVVKYRPVIKQDGQLKLNNDLIEKEVENIFLSNLRGGDFVTIHFSTAIEKITAEEFQNLLHITERSLEKFNEQSK